MGLGNRLLPSRAASPDRRVTFPSVTVSDYHSLMLAVDRLGGRVFPALAFEGFATPAAAQVHLLLAPLPLCHVGKGKSELGTFHSSELGPGWPPEPLGKRRQFLLGRRPGRLAAGLGPPGLCLLWNCQGFSISPLAHPQAVPQDCGQRS